MKFTIFILCCLTLPSRVFAQAEADPHDEVLRHVGRDTAFFAWLDISQFDFVQMNEYLETFDEQLGPGGDYQNEKVVQQALIQLKVQRVYWISPVDSQSIGVPQFVVPSENPTDVAALLNSLLQGSGMQAVEDQTHVLVGTPDGIARLKTPNGTPPENFSESIRNCKLPHGLVVAQPDSVMPLLLATLIERLKPEQAAMLAKQYSVIASIVWARLNCELPPQKADVIIETGSAEDANALQTLMTALLTSRLGPQADALTFEVIGRQLQKSTISLDQSSDSLLAILEFMTDANSTIMNQLKQIGLAMHNFHDVKGYLPPQALADKDGKKLLSWRVLILPYIEQSALYNEFHLDEAWDSPHNLKLAEIVPSVYLAKDVKQSGPYKTRLVAPLTVNSAFGKPGEATRFQDIRDGLSNTVLIVETAPENAVIWTKPEDIVVDVSSPLASIISATANGFFALIGDGSARFFERANVDNEMLRGFLSIDGEN
jgi:hypothetical protein